MRRAVDVFGACCCALALAVSGCEAPSSRDTIVIGLGTEPETLLPVVEASAIEGELPFLGVLLKRETDTQLASAAHRRGRVN